MISGKKQRRKIALKINSIVIQETNAVISLGIAINNILKFSEQVGKLSRLANFKLTYV